jgi:hypothetical protein
MGKNLLHTGRYRDGKNDVGVKVSLITFQEEGLFFMYSPALDLTGYGKTEEEAKSSYHLAMEEFLKYTTHKKTLFRELERLGWTISKMKKFSAPTLPELIKSRDYLVEIFTEKQYRKSDEMVSLPSLA